MRLRLDTTVRFSLFMIFVLHGRKHTLRIYTTAARAATITTTATILCVTTTEPPSTRLPPMTAFDELVYYGLGYRSRVDDRRRLSVLPGDWYPAAAAVGFFFFFISTRTPNCTCADQLLLSRNSRYFRVDENGTFMIIGVWSRRHT